MIDIEKTAAAARAASRRLASLTTETKNAVLTDLADALGHDESAILDANQHDMESARSAGLAESKLRRLELSAASIARAREGLNQIAGLPDPVGTVTRDEMQPSGLRVRRMRAPLGVVAMIYEARPLVTIDAFSLCFKAGNASILKGGKEATRSNSALAAIAHGVLRSHEIPEAALTPLTGISHAAVEHLLTLDQYVDLVIPRGGTGLIEFVHEHSRIPTVQHFHGVCHVFVDASADVDRAVELCATAKTSGPATCNALECVLVHQDIAGSFVPALAERLAADGVELRVDDKARALAPAASAATESDWGHEYLDLVLALRVVNSMDEAIDHIGRFGSNHTDAILTHSDENARTFVAGVQSSCVLVNASTRFNDGFQLGLGAEIGISTSRIHAYGPMGLEELTTQRFVAEGDMLVL